MSPCLFQGVTEHCAGLDCSVRGAVIRCHGVCDEPVVHGTDSQSSKCVIHYAYMRDTEGSVVSVVGLSSSSSNETGRSCQVRC